jgi:hypothetical protein
LVALVEDEPPAGEAQPEKGGSTTIPSPLTTTAGQKIETNQSFPSPEYLLQELELY